MFELEKFYDIIDLDIQYIFLSERHVIAIKYSPLLLSFLPTFKSSDIDKTCVYPVQ